MKKTITILLLIILCAGIALALQSGEKQIPLPERFCNDLRQLDATREVLEANARTINAKRAALDEERAKINAQYEAVATKEQLLLEKAQRLLNCDACAIAPDRKTLVGK